MFRVFVDDLGGNAAPLTLLSQVAWRTAASCVARAMVAEVSGRQK
jgi:hypothetical protein